MDDLPLSPLPMTSWCRVHDFFFHSPAAMAKMLGAGEGARTTGTLGGTCCGTPTFSSGAFSGRAPPSSSSTTLTGDRLDCRISGARGGLGGTSGSDEGMEGLMLAGDSDIVDAPLADDSQSHVTETDGALNAPPSRLRGPYAGPRALQRLKSA